MFTIKFNSQDDKVDRIYDVSSVSTMEEANKIKLALLGLGYTAWIEEAAPGLTHSDIYGAIFQAVEQEMDCLFHKGAQLEELRNVAIEVVHDLVNDWIANERGE